MYCTVTIPKMAYAIDVWYVPIHRKVGASRCSRLVGINNKFRSTQRLASTVMTGALCTAPTDLLDLHAGIWPVHLLFSCLCHRAAVRLTYFPLCSLFQQRVKQYIKTHRLHLEIGRGNWGVFFSTLTLTLVDDRGFGG